MDEFNKIMRLINGCISTASTSKKLITFRVINYFLIHENLNKLNMFP